MAKEEWPKWMYGPNDQARVFQKDDVVPAGWSDHPEKLKQEVPPTPPVPQQRPAKKSEKAAPVAEPQQEPAPEPSQEEKLETIRSLREAGVEISDDASVDEINAAIDRLTAQAEGK